MPQPESDSKPESPGKVGLQRRNSIPKHKEQWVVSDRIKTPSPTPPMTSSFVAKKSRPDETVSFSLPPGGYNPKPNVPKPKPLNLHVDELFSQYFPEVREERKTFNETPVKESIDKDTEKQPTFEQINYLVEGILDELLIIIVNHSSLEEAFNKEEQKDDAKSSEGKAEEQSQTSCNISSDSPIRSRNVSAESSRSGFSSNSHENFDDYKEDGDTSSEKEMSSRRKKRKSDNLGLNGGYWDVLGVRGGVREKLEKQESIEKEEKTQIKKENRSRRRETLSKSASQDIETEILNESKKSIDEVQNQNKESKRTTETSKDVLSNGHEENVTFVQSLIYDIILSLKTNEETKCPPKQTTMKRSPPPTENKPSKRQKIHIKETNEQENTLYEIQDGFCAAEINSSLPSKDSKPVESKTENELSRKKSSKNSRVNKKKSVTNESINLESKPKPNMETDKQSVDKNKKKQITHKNNKEQLNGEEKSTKVDIYEFYEEDLQPGNESNKSVQKNPNICARTDILEEKYQKKANKPEMLTPFVEEIEDETDLQDRSEDVNEPNSSNNDIWNSINETLKDLKESTNNKQITKQCRRERTPVVKEKIQPVDDCKDYLLDDLNSSQNSELDGWPIGCDLKDEITGDNIDIWASTNEIMRSISESLSDVTTSKPTPSISCLQNKKESKASLESSRKPRQKRKDSDENLGNPDSGKENADIDNVDLVKSESKKSERVLSPVTKRRKIINRKYINDDFDDSHSPNRQKETKVIKDSKQSESGHQSKRKRSSSSSTDEGSENEAKKPLKDSEKTTKLISTLYKPSSTRKTIKIIDPSPTDPEALKDKPSKLKTSKSKSFKDSSPQPGKGEKSKSETTSRVKPVEDKNNKKSINQDPKVMNNSSIGKSKSSWSSKASNKANTKPSTDLVNFLDKEYEKVKKEEVSKIKFSKK